MPRHNWSSPITTSLVTNASTVNGGVTYLPSTGFLHNVSWAELRIYIQRLPAGTGTLNMSFQEYDPTLNIWNDARDAAGAILGSIAYAAGIADTALTWRLLRIAHGILGGNTTGVATVNTNDKWVDYTPSEFWRLKLTESATGSTVKIGSQYLRGV
jgi:hypothetical protein